MKKRLIALLIVLAAAFAAFAAFRFSGARSIQLFGGLVHRVETDRPVVALTFDDGPTPEASDEILSILRDERIRATFFFTGAELAENPDLGRRFVDAGHEIGNHSRTHRRFLLKSPGFIRHEVESTDSLIRATGYGGDIHFRPPYGKKLWGLPRYLTRTDRTTIMWDVEPDSYPEVAATSDGIVSHVLERARPGSIIILHVMYPSRRTSMDAVRGIAAGLRERGYEFVTVSELLGG